MEIFTDDYFMREALKEAAKALAISEVPVGAVVVCRNRIIARAHNQTEKLTDATAQWEKDSVLATVATLLILGGAVGKSAQLPLQVWLPDAMAGPSPVSALMHAATMVTAGVYLIARTHPLFELAPQTQWLVAAIGALTIVYGASAALAQTDFKKVLAYSTISQIVK